MVCVGRVFWGLVMAECKQHLEGKIKCLGIKLYIKLGGIIDDESDIVSAPWEINKHIAELFGKDEQLKKLGLLSCNGQPEYEVIGKDTRYEFIMCPACLSDNVEENAVQVSVSPLDYEQYMQCNACGYLWDDEGEYVRYK